MTTLTTHNMLQNPSNTFLIHFNSRHTTKDRINSVDNAIAYDASTKLIDNQWGYPRHELRPPSQHINEFVKYV